MHSAPEGIGGLLLAAYHLQAKPGGLKQRIGQILAVLTVPDGAGGHQQSLLGAAHPGLVI